MSSFDRPDAADHLDAASTQAAAESAWDNDSSWTQTGAGIKPRALHTCIDDSLAKLPVPSPGET